MKLLILNTSGGLREKCSILYLSSRVLDVVCSSDRRATSYTSATQSRLHRYLLLGFRLSWLVRWSCALVVLALACSQDPAGLAPVDHLPAHRPPHRLATNSHFSPQPATTLPVLCHCVPTTNSRSGHSSTGGKQMSERVRFFYAGGGAAGQRSSCLGIPSRQRPMMALHLTHPPPHTYVLH